MDEHSSLCYTIVSARGRSLSRGQAARCVLAGIGFRATHSHFHTQHAMHFYSSNTARCLFPGEVTVFAQPLRAR